MRTTDPNAYLKTFERRLKTIQVELPHWASTLNRAELEPFARMLTSRDVAVVDGKGFMCGIDKKTGAVTIVIATDKPGELLGGLHHEINHILTPTRTLANWMEEPKVKVLSDAAQKMVRFVLHCTDDAFIDRLAIKSYPGERDFLSKLWKYGIPEALKKPYLVACCDLYIHAVYGLRPQAGNRYFDKLWDIFKGYDFSAPVSNDTLDRAIEYTKFVMNLTDAKVPDQPQPPKKQGDGQSEGTGQSKGQKKVGKGTAGTKASGTEKDHSKEKEEDPEKESRDGEPYESEDEDQTKGTSGENTDEEGEDSGKDVSEGEETESVQSGGGEEHPQSLNDGEAGGCETPTGEDIPDAGPVELSLRHTDEKGAKDKDNRRWTAPTITIAYDDKGNPSVLTDRDSATNRLHYQVIERRLCKQPVFRELDSVASRYAPMIQSKKKTVTYARRGTRVGNQYLTRVVAGKVSAYDSPMLTVDSKKCFNNLHVGLLLDFSSSMISPFHTDQNGNCWTAMDFTGSVGKYLGEVFKSKNIPYEMLAYSTQGDGEHEYPVVLLIKKVEEDFASKYKTPYLKVPTSGTTPTAEGMRSMIFRMIAIRGKRKIVFHITDGGPNRTGNYTTPKSFINTISKDIFGATASHSGSVTKELNELNEFAKRFCDTEVFHIVLGMRYKETETLAKMYGTTPEHIFKVDTIEEFDTVVQSVLQLTVTQ